MKIVNRLQYIFLYILSFVIIGATSVITGEVGINLLKDPAYYITQLLIYAAILCITFATLYAYIDKFESTNEEYLDNINYISTFAKSKENIPSILSRFLEGFNKKRKVKQFEFNIKKKLHELENKRKYKIFGPRVYNDRDFYIWNHGTLEEKLNNKYCKARMELEEQLTEEYIKKNIDVKLIKYDKVTSDVLLGGFYKNYANSGPNDFIEKNPSMKVVKHKIPQLLYSFAFMFLLSSIVFDSISLNTNTLINICVKSLTLLWNCYTTIRYAQTYTQTVTLKDSRFRKGIILEYEKWLRQEAKETQRLDKEEVIKKESEKLKTREVTTREVVVYDGNRDVQINFQQP